MSRTDRPRGVGGDRFSTDPVGAVLRVGKKNDRGVPVDRDRFYIALPHEDGSGTRPEHPSFAAFNKAAPDQRRHIRANLVSGSLRDAFDLQRYAYRLPKPPYDPPPNKRPGCEGDGKVAIRYVDGDFRNIACPGDLCEFAQAGMCKVRLAILFRPRWSDTRWPASLMRYASHAEHNLASIYGLFDHVADIAYSLDILDERPYETEGYLALEKAGIPVFGLPFSMTLTERTNKQKGTRFPVVQFAPDGDLVGWLAGVLQQRRELGGARDALLLSAGMQPASVADDTDDVIDVDHLELTVEATDAEPPTKREAPKPAAAPEPPPPQPQPAPLSAKAEARILTAAEAKGYDLAAVEDLLGCPLADLTADDEKPTLDRIELLPARKAAK